jgi:hypothetical protein
MTDARAVRPRAAFAAPVRVLVCLLVALAALLTRVVLDARAPARDGVGFSSWDPDSLYQMRRLDRFLATGWPALWTDAFLDHPHGSAIPWPPGYALVQAALVGPFVPRQDATAARRAVEQGVASLPLAWGVLAAVVVALCGMRLAGPTAGAAAGLGMALCGATVESSRWGNGDHHAFVVLLVAGWLAVVAGACRARAPRRSAAVLAGLLCGAALVTWLPCVFVVAVGVVTMLAMLLREAPDGSTAAARWWLTSWVAALLVVVPFAAASPWSSSEPWNPVYLTWIQPAALLVAALVPASRLLLAARAPGAAGAAGSAGAAGAAPARRLLLAWAGAFAAGAAAFPFVRQALPGGLDEAAGVLMRADDWHDMIIESRPMFGAAAHPLGVHGLLGFGAWLVPVAFVLLAREAWRARDAALACLIALAAVTGAAALMQGRFADLFAIPASLLLALLLQRALAALVRRPDVRLPAAGTAVAGLLTLAALQAPTFARMVAHDPADQAVNGATSNAVLAWLDTQGDALPDGAVLATWSRGHAVMWIGGRPSIACNFGAFAGRDGFLAPARFFLGTDAGAAEALLAARDAALVMVRGNQPASVRDQLRMLGVEGETALVHVDAQGRLQVGRAWMETMGGKLFAFADGSLGVPADKVAPPGFLRLVHASEAGLPGPASWLYERVAGARLRVRARPGERVRALVAVTLAPGGPPRTYVATAVADGTGQASLRVPYATGTQGSVQAGACRVEGEGRGAEVAVPEQAVRHGEDVDVSLDAL